MFDEFLSSLSLRRKRNVPSKFPVSRASGLGCSICACLVTHLYITHLYSLNDDSAYTTKEASNYFDALCCNLRNIVGKTTNILSLKYCTRSS